MYSITCHFAYRPLVTERGLSSRLHCTRELMQPHRFKVGEFVRFSTGKYLGVPQGRYQIVRLMPPTRDNQNQYHVRSVESGVERMVREPELS
jgi:hypothetical protein